MRTSRLMLWILAIAALFVLILMNVWTVPIIRADAGNLHIFDNRPFGYSLGDAQAFLNALKPEGLELYLTLQRKLDTLFPILFSIAMPWALWVLTARWNTPFRIFICAAGFIGPMCDLTENYFVAKLLRAGPDEITAEMVSIASTFSVTKWGLDLIASCTFLLLGWHALLERWKSK